MDAVIPAAGRGSRLGELTADRPKGLVDVAGRPLLAHVFETAVDAGADALVVIVGYEAAQIVDRFGDTFEGVPITYVHQRERLGLGHAVVQAEPSSTLVTTGCYVLPEDIFHACALVRPSAEGEYQLSEAVGLLVRAGYDVATVRLGERVNVNTSEDVERANETVRGESRTNRNG
ncbi:sugar phosphate nucleotidyltransferase [Halorubrum amylolyticum]|uniref:sugar phosphate nucleotidyltransferase n=1 Tax=Halorubrum amylolyticum TaxID=2508724 RepID=UPI0010091716|nr:sugar phosphate nucleotidyltransferase [Halorubrum amylolyticum]